MILKFKKKHTSSPEQTYDICGWMTGLGHVTAGAHRGQKRASNPLKQQVIVSFPHPYPDILRSQFRCYERAAILTTEQLQALESAILKENQSCNC